MRRFNPFCLAAVAVLAACGGTAPGPPITPRGSIAAATAPRPAAASAPSAHAGAGQPESTAIIPAEPNDAEEAARAFVDGIARHDADGLAHVYGEAFGRGQARRFKDVSDARLDGPAMASEWPYQSDMTLFWATFTTNGVPERILLGVGQGVRATSGAPSHPWRVSGIRGQAEREISERDRVELERLLHPVEMKGKLLSKPKRGSLTVLVEGRAPDVGARVELLRQIDAAVPLVGGAWLVIAGAEVMAVDWKTVTLRVVAEKADVKVNGRKVDHFTPGIPVIIRR